MSSFADFEALDQALAEHGFPPCSKWWLGEVRRLYSNKQIRQWTARVGRGGSKSTTLAKLAINEALHGAFKIPRGELHYFGLVSTSKDEAAQRLGQISAMLTALDVEHSRSGDTIEIADTGRGIRVMACQIAAVSGFRAFGFAGDEVAKWTNADTSTNPAPEVAASARAMCVTHRSAKMFFFSSPLSTSDFHAELVEKGESASAIVSTASTWEATDDRISEEATRDLEPDERIWKREYLAVPQSAKLAAFDPDDVATCFALRSDLGRAYRQIGIIDASSGRKDRFTFGFAGWRDSGRGPVLVVDPIGSFDPRQVRDYGIEACVEHVCSLAKQRGVRVVLGDQRESMSLRALFGRHGVALREMTWTSSSKPRAVTRVRRWLLSRQLAVPPNLDAMRRELLSFEEKIDAAGSFTFGARGSGHDDYVALLLTAALGDEEMLFQGSPQMPAPTGASAAGGRMKFDGRGRQQPTTANNPMLRALWYGDATLTYRGGQTFVQGPRVGELQDWRRYF